MSDTTERDAVCQEFGAWYRGEIPEEVHWKSAEAMADEIVRLRAAAKDSADHYADARAEIERLRFAIERVRALHAPIANSIPKCATCKDYSEYHVDLPCPTLRVLDADIQASFIPFHILDGDA